MESNTVEIYTSSLCNSAHTNNNNKPQRRFMIFCNWKVYTDCWCYLVLINNRGLIIKDCRKKLLEMRFYNTYHHYTALRLIMTVSEVCRRFSPNTFTQGNHFIYTW